ncbi:hypothetical protein ACIKP7_07895 [Pseudomonas caricapapayae]|jgi:hypothetical protein|uniref:Uncharacterized protein n=1 Tax=Pseudomonas caricapapayae TaxID=46678 RepID=A0ACC7LT40_9PSED
MNTLIDLALSGFGGAAAAVIITIYYEKSSQRRQLVLSLIETYLKYAPLRAHAKWVFDSCHSGNTKCIFSSPKASKEEQRTARRNYNKLIELGDWYEVVAMLYRTSALDKYLFDVSGLRSEVWAFGKEIIKINGNGLGKFEESWPSLFYLAKR